MSEKKSMEDMLKELEKLAGEIETKKKTSSKRKKSSSKQKEIKDEKIKEDLNKVKEIKKSLEVLEKEVFVKINDPEKIINNLLESKKRVKDITTSLMALIKLSKLREEIIERLNKDISALRELSKEIEHELNLDEYTKTLGKEIGKIDEDIITQYIDTIEEDIEEIRRYMGIAK